MAKFVPEKNSEGRFKTRGLTSKAFNAAFELIGNLQKKNRRKARRTLPPAFFKNKSLENMLSLGKKADGTFFVPEDLNAFEKSIKEIRNKFKRDVPGITYAQLIDACLKADVDRASNNVDDGSGITSAVPVSLKHNVMNISVTASSISVHQHHRVRVRFEEWDRYVGDITEDSKDARSVTRSLCAGRLSIDCDCGRHQYWFRFIATAGNFAVAPPKEYAFPKIRNPSLRGVACKHVIHALTRLQSVSWQMSVTKALQTAASRVAYGDDSRKKTENFTDADKKRFNRNRKSKTDQAEIRRAYQAYQRRTEALEKQVSATTESLEKQREKLKKARVKVEEDKRRNREEKKKNKEEQKQLLKDRADLARQKSDLEKREREAEKARQAQADNMARSRDLFEVRKQEYIDRAVMQGKSEKEAEAEFMAWIKAGPGGF